MGCGETHVWHGLAPGVAAIALSTWGMTCSAAAEPAANLVKNPSFEEGTPFKPHGWESSFGAEWADVARSGKRCLGITRPREERPQQYWSSDPIPIESGKRWMTLSAWFKASDVGLLWNEAERTYNVNLTAVFLDAAGRELGVEEQISEHGNKLAGWAYKEANFAVPRGAAALRLRFCFGRPQTVGTGWMDDVTLTYAEASGAARTGEAITGTYGLQLTSQRAGMIFYPEDALKFPMRTSGDPLPPGTTLRYHVQGHAGQVVERGRAPIDSKASVLLLARRKEYREGLYYEVHASLESGGKTLTTDTLSFGIMAKRPYDPKSKPDPFELCGHTTSVRENVEFWVPIALERLGVRHSYLIGCDPSDDVLAWCREARAKYGIDFSTNGPIRCTNWGRKDAKHRFYDSEEALRTCLTEVVSRYKGAISRLGIMGELVAPTPAATAEKAKEQEAAELGLWGTGLAPEKDAREQVDLMRVFREVVQKIDPRIQVAPGGYFNPEMDMLLDAGMNQYADVWMIHKFVTPKTTDEHYRTTINCFAKRGLKVPPLWVDESMCGTSQEDTAAEIVKMNAIYLFYETAYANWHPFIHHQGIPSAMFCRCPDRQGDIVPRMPFFTYAVMTKHLRGVTPAEKFDLGSGAAVAYLFRHGTESVLVAWKWEEEEAVQVRLTLPEEQKAVALFNLWDARTTLHPKNRQILFGLTTSPIFLRFEGKPGEVVALTKPVMSVATVSVSTASPAEVPVEITNMHDVPLEGTVRLIVPQHWKTEPTDMPVKLASGASMKATLRVRAGGDYLTGTRHEGMVNIVSAGGVVASVPIALNLVEPIKLSLRMTKAGNDAAVVTRVENLGPAVTGKLALKTAFTRSLRPAVLVRESLQLKAGETTEVTVPLDCPVNQPDMYPVEAEFATSEGRTSKATETLSAFFCTRASRPHAITGQLEDDDWQGVEPQVLASDLYAKFHEPVHTYSYFYRYWANDMAWKTPEHWHVKLWTQWDEENLYLRVKVRETNHLNEFRGQAIWAGDCLQIAVDASPFQPGKLRHGFNVALTKDDGVVVQRCFKPYGSELPTGAANLAGVVKANIKWYPDKRYCVYDLAFPKAQIVPARLAEGSVIGMTVINVNRQLREDVDPPVLRWGTGFYGAACDPMDIRVNLVQANG